MRWKFYAAGESPHEDEQRAQQVARIDLWWRAFEAQCASLDRLFNDEARWDLVGWMRENLQAIHPRLMWEFGPGTNRGHRLIITPEAEHHLRPLVEEIIARAPNRPGWLFSGYRVPEPASHLPRTISSRTGEEPLFTGVALAPGELNRVDLTFQFPADVLLAKREQAHAQAFVAAEALLGEDMLIDWLGKLDTTSDAALALPPGAVPRGFAALAAQQRSKLPSQPLLERAAALEWAEIELKPKETGSDYAHRYDLLSARTAVPDLWRNAHSDQSFWSGRFSRCGETFCYLKLDLGSEGSEQAREQRDRLESLIDRALREARVGCTIGGGIGLRYSYIDLALTDVRAASKVLRGCVQPLRVSFRRAWLLFFDSTLAAEWIGMWPDSPPPPMPWQ
jgi:hypothetical protein